MEGLLCLPPIRLLSQLVFSMLKSPDDPKTIKVSDYRNGML